MPMILVSGHMYKLATIGTHRRPSGALWIDAVCINQVDIQERNQQVATMADVYGNTTTNLVWLGEEEEYTVPALAAVEAINTEMREDTDSFKLLSETLYTRDGGWRFDGTSYLRTECDATSLMRLLSLDWFTRLWVVQEAALAPGNICHVGELKFGLDGVLRAAAWLVFRAPGYVNWPLYRDTLTHAVTMFDWTDPQYGRWALGLNKVDVAELLDSMRVFDTYDARDHVFGLVGLLKKHTDYAPTPSALAPDYNAPLKDVLHRVMKHIIHERADFEMLHSVSHHPDEGNEAGIASWVPPWYRSSSRKTDPIAFGGPWQGADNAYNHNASCEAVELEVLNATGFELCTVHEVKAVFHNDYVEDALDLVADTNALVHSITAEYDDRVDIAGVVLCAEATRDNARCTQRDAGAACSRWQTTTQEWLALDEEREPYLDYLRRGEAIQFYSAMVNANRNRRSFTTTSSSIGIGPWTTRRDDIVAILYGCRFPVIIRKHEAYPGDCEFVGTCYVYSIMDGEAVHKHKVEGKEDKTFRLR
ncbi:hypothetical protein DOTSEDRAFT_53039 [Dothistroma septosporum NZE10]|uniref:Heterokaryon incompatibility domain-containing protein n=1 Tax=Dothistroma septosporum (strain NZE10 / CBS 128990) TaxID=675120 RepID=N1PMS3_DOTSN|nr:hypothetical protein DOTSEDRAFT_53039 [Dothistroma septosporum NZE10]